MANGYDDLDIMEKEQDFSISATTDYYIPIDFAFDTCSQRMIKDGGDYYDKH